MDGMFKELCLGDAEMNLYLLTQTTNTGYDTYDSCIVAARSEQEAKTITPKNDTFDKNENGYSYGNRGWCGSAEQVHCTKIGTAIKGTQKGVILASFNAG